jgi:peptidoglycan/LPS O-acetylase OafA/YrhL
MSITKKVATKITPLTSARFFAALFVVFYHGWPGLRRQHDFLSRVFALGYTSVSFFFMLSGFILAVVYLNSGEPIDKRRFFVSRFARIYPLYLAALALDMPHFLHAERYVTHSSATHIILATLASFGLVQAWFPTLMGIDFPSWSLSAEAFFYLLFPFVGPLLAKMRGIRSIALAAVFYILGICLVQTLHSRDQAYLPLPHLFIFLIGVNLGLTYRSLVQSPIAKSVLERIAPYMVAGSVLLFLALPLFSVDIPERFLQHGLLAPLFALIILGLASENRFILKLFSPGWLVTLGESSFALYLIHVPIGAILRLPIERFGLYMFLCSVLLSVYLSILSFKYLELPCRQWILKTERVRSSERVLTSSLMQ